MQNDARRCNATAVNKNIDSHVFYMPDALTSGWTGDTRGLWANGDNGVPTSSVNRLLSWLLSGKGL